MRSDSGSSQKPTTECDAAPSSASYSATCSLSTTESSTVLAKARTLPLAEVSLQDDRKQCTGDDYILDVLQFLTRIRPRPNAALKFGPFCCYFTSAAQPLEIPPTAPSTSAGRLVPPIGLLYAGYYVVLNN
jgi:hypothetical protein